MSIEGEELFKYPTIICSWFWFVISNEIQKRGYANLRSIIAYTKKTATNTNLKEFTKELADPYYQIFDPESIKLDKYQFHLIDSIAPTTIATEESKNKICHAECMKRHYRQVTNNIVEGTVDKKSLGKESKVICLQTTCKVDNYAIETILDGEYLLHKYLRNFMPEGFRICLYCGRKYTKQANDKHSCQYCTQINT